MTSTEARVVKTAAVVVPTVVVFAILPILAAVMALSAALASVGWLVAWAIRTDRSEKHRARFFVLVRDVEEHV